MVNLVNDFPISHFPQHIAHILSNPSRPQVPIPHALDISPLLADPPLNFHFPHILAILDHIADYGLMVVPIAKELVDQQDWDHLYGLEV